MGRKKNCIFSNRKHYRKHFFILKKWKIRLLGFRIFYIMMIDESCFWILISREDCVIIVQTHMMTSFDAVTSSDDVIKVFSPRLFKLSYYVKQIDFIFLCFCTVIDHRRHSTSSRAILFCSSHAMASTVIY